MRSPLGAFIFVALLLIIEIYVFQALKTISTSSSPRTKTIIYTSYWIFFVLVMAGFLLLTLTRGDMFPKIVRSYLFALIVGFFLSMLVAAFFLLIDDLRRLVQWIAMKIVYNSRPMDTVEADGISRSVFLSWLSLAIGGGLYSSFIYGFSNKYNYQVKT